MKKIEKSNNYGLFQFHDEQRTHNERKLQKLKASMLKWGYLESKPITAIRKPGGKFKIIDGHTRFEAARQLGISFYYVVEDNKLDEAVADLNEWPLLDCVKRWATRGVEDYVELIRYMDHGIKVSAAASLLVGQLSHSANCNDSLREGTWKIKTRDLIDTIVQFIKELGTECPVVKTTRFHDALSMCLFVPDFESDRLLHKLRVNSRMLVKVATRDQMLEQLEEIYNFKAVGPTKLPLAFNARTAARDRNPTNKPKA